MSKQVPLVLLHVIPLAALESSAIKCKVSDSWSRNLKEIFFLAIRATVFSSAFMLEQSLVGHHRGLQVGHHCSSASDPLFIRVFLVFFSKLLYYRQFTYIPLHIGCFPRRFLLQPTISQIPLPLGNSPTSGSPGWHTIYTSKSSAKQVAAILGTQKRRRLTKPKLRLVLPQVARVIILCFPSGRRGRAWVRGWGIAGFGDEIGIDWDRSVT